MIRALQSLRTEFPPLLRLALPLVLAEMGWMVMGVVDTMMVGRLPASAESIGAVSLGLTPHNVTIFFGLGMLLGLDTLVSQAFGAGRINDCHRSLVNGIYLGVAITPLLMAAVYGVIPWLAAMGIHPDILPLAVPYLKAVVWSTLPLMIYFAVRRYLQAMNLANPILFALISANIVNVAANWALIFGKWGFPAMGVEGSAWATFISRAYMALVLVGYTLYHSYRMRTGLWQARLLADIERLRELVRLGFPAAIQMTLEISMFAIVTALVARMEPASLAAHHITLSVAALTFMMPLGVSSAAAVRVGQGIGRGDPRGASQAGWSALLVGAGLMICAAATFVLWPRQIAGVFTGDETVLRLSVTLLALAAVFQIFDGLQIVATGALRGAGDTRTAMVSHIFGYWGLGLPLAYYLAFTRGMGVIGIWTGLTAALVFVGIFLLVAWSVKVRRLNDELR